jgi:hypothetical protein
LYRLLIVLSCQVLKEAGELEKLGSPVAIDETAAAPAAANNAPPQQPTNVYAQGHQQPQKQAPQQQVAQTRPSQYISEIYDINK